MDGDLKKNLDRGTGRRMAMATSQRQQQTLSQEELLHLLLSFKLPGPLCTVHTHTERWLRQRCQSTLCIVSIKLLSWNLPRPVSTEQNYCQKIDCWVFWGLSHGFVKWFLKNNPIMDCAPNVNIFRELQLVHDHGYFSSHVSPEEHWQQV